MSYRWNNLMNRFSQSLWSNVCKTDRKLISIKQIELKSDWTTNLIHTITETGVKKTYECHPDSPKYYHLRCLPSPDIYIILDFISGNKEHIVWMTLTCLPIDGKLQVILGLSIDTRTKTSIVETQLVETDHFKCFTCPPGWIRYPFIAAILKNTPPDHINCQNGKFWMNLIETSLRRRGYNKENLRINLNCKWTPISLPRWHNITNILWIPDEIPHLNIHDVWTQHQLYLIWQHPATNNHQEVTKVEWCEQIKKLSQLLIARGNYNRELGDSNSNKRMKSWQSFNHPYGKTLHLHTPTTHLIR